MIKVKYLSLVGDNVTAYFISLLHCFFFISITFYWFYFICIFSLFFISLIYFWNNFHGSFALQLHSDRKIYRAPNYYILIFPKFSFLLLFFYFIHLFARRWSLRYVRHYRYARSSRIEFSTLRPALIPCTRTLALRTEYRNALRPPRYRNPGVNALRINESGVAISCELLDVRARGL